MTLKRWRCSFRVFCTIGSIRSSACCHQQLELFVGVSIFETFSLKLTKYYPTTSEPTRPASDLSQFWPNGLEEHSITQWFRGAPMLLRWTFSLKKSPTRRERGMDRAKFHFFTEFAARRIDCPNETPHSPEAFQY